jgi:raffinose/stachyose/melibiose transport system permease protein
MRSHTLYPHYFILPALLLYLALFILPSIIGFGYGLTNWNAWSDTLRWIGLENFAEILSGDPRYLVYIENTVLFAVVTTALKVVIGLALALLLSGGLKSSNALRTVFYLPVVLSPLVIGLIFTSIFNPTRGLLTQALRALGLSSLTRNWLVDLSTAMPAVMGVEVWRMSGYCMVIFLAGLKVIPPNLFEAADIDGASAAQKFLRITLPFLQPALSINVILNLIWGLKVFDLVFVLTRGGPGYATGVLNTAVFFEYSSGRYGMATALGVVIFLITSVVALLVLRALNSRTVELA